MYSWRYCRHRGLRAQWRTTRARSADNRVAARSVRHDSGSAVGGATTITANPAHPFHQFAPSAYGTVAGAGDEPVLDRRPQVVAVRAYVLRGGCTGGTPIALVALASRRHRGACHRDLCGPGVLVAVDRSGSSAQATGERPRRRGELLRSRRRRHFVWVRAAALAIPGPDRGLGRVGRQCGVQADLHRGGALDGLRRRTGGRPAGARSRSRDVSKPSENR